MGTELQANSGGELILSKDLHELAIPYSGDGVSTDPADILIPMIYVLQTNSPICDKRSENYIQGAEPGHFWLRNSPNPIASGIDGIYAIPVRMEHTWVEWLPNRQGFVARHLKAPEDMEVKTIHDDSGREKQSLVRSNGNLIQETREFYVLVENQPFVLPCTGTKHTFARGWQTKFKYFRNRINGNIMPSYAHKYRLQTVPVSNALGKWFGLKEQDVGEVTNDEFKLAIQLAASLRSNEYRAETPTLEDPPF